MNTFKRNILITGMIAALTACGGDSSGSKEGQISLGLTDAPVDSLQSVVVTVTGVSLKPQNGNAQTITFTEPKVIDMLDLQNGAVETLLDNYTMPAGEYNWVRLELSTEENALYVVDDLGGTVGLTIPSGFQTGLKLNTGFVIPQGGDANFTIDFDLRKSVTKPNGQTDYFLKPSLRLIDNASVGTLSGEVSSTLIQNECANSAEFAGLVYVFTGSDVTPDDYDENTSNALSAGKVSLNDESGNYTFTVPFLSSGNYTIAYSCTIDDTLLDETLTFVQAQNVTINTNTTTSADFE